MLPWIYPGAPHFILAYNYRRDRAAGRRFERDGIGGLIADGYFGALLMNVPTGRFDGAQIAVRYEKRGRCGEQDIWLRR